MKFTWFKFFRGWLILALIWRAWFIFDRVFIGQPVDFYLELMDTIRGTVLLVVCMITAKIFENKSGGNGGTGGTESKVVDYEIGEDGTIKEIKK